jgi:hypothetical protein
MVISVGESRWVMRNRMVTWSAAMASTALLAGILLAQQAGAGLLKPGAKVPGAFHVLSVTQPPTMLKPIPQAGRFHCPVCEYRLNPVVLIFARQPDSGEEAGKSASLTSLLKKLDAAIDKHADVQIGACAIFNDGGYMKQVLADLDEATSVSVPVKDVEFTKAIEFKEALEAKLKSLAKSADFKHVALSMGSPPEAYAIPANNDVRVLFYANHEVILDEAFPRDKLTDAAIEKIVKTVEDKATEKPGK